MNSARRAFPLIGLIAAAGCAGGEPAGSANGGRPGGAAMCPALTGCTGNIVGEWRFEKACIPLSLELPPDRFCPEGEYVPRLEASGRTSYGADGRFFEAMSVGMVADAKWPASCIAAFGSCARLATSLKSPDVHAVDCSEAAAGACHCRIALRPAVTWLRGTYKLAGGSLERKERARTETQTACVSGDTLTLGLPVRREDGQPQLPATLTARRASATPGPELDAPEAGVLLVKVTEPRLQGTASFAGTIEFPAQIGADTVQLGVGDQVDTRSPVLGAFSLPVSGFHTPSAPISSLSYVVEGIAPGKYLVGALVDVDPPGPEGDWSGLYGGTATAPVQRFGEARWLELAGEAITGVDFGVGRPR